MEDGSTSTPDPLDSAGDSHQPSTTSKTPAPKDRECQFCRQPFTSSSLGRHLDQYIKPENPKKPDGVHDVEAIRKERGGITRRRKGRVSSDRHGSAETHEAAVATPMSAPAPVSPSLTVSPLNAVPKGGVRTRINSLTWHTTGVINEALETRRDAKPIVPPLALKRTAVKAEILKRQDGANDRDTARALELALKEVLDNVRAANVRAQPSPSPFEFDLQSQSFPALCLLCLPPPPSLFSVHPFSTSFSWPLDPPGSPQLDSVRQYLRSQIHQWRMSQNSASRRANPKPGSSVQKENVDRLSQEYEETVTSHLATAFKHWSSLPATQQHETYHLEILRAFAREIEKRKSVDAQLVRVQQEADHLRAQVEKLSSCQMPREFALFPPDTLPIVRSAAKDLHSSSGKFEDWDYDRLVGKWQEVVRGDRRNRSGMNAQRPLPGGDIDAGPLNQSIPTTGTGLANGHSYPTTTPHLLGRAPGPALLPQAMTRKVNGAASEDADGEDDNETGYGRVLMEMSGSGGEGGNRLVDMEDAQ